MTAEEIAEFHCDLHRYDLSIEWDERDAEIACLRDALARIERLASEAGTDAALAGARAVARRRRALR